MSFKKPLSFGVALLVLLSAVLVAMTQPGRSRVERIPDFVALPSTVKMGGAPRQGSIGLAGTQIIHAARLNPQQQLQRDLAHLEIFLNNKDLDGFVKAADELEKNWSQEGGEYYGRLMLNISNLVVNGFQDDRIDRLSQKYAFEALAHADSFSLDLETKLLAFIANDLAQDTASPAAVSEWNKERNTKAKLWLHALQRLERETDRNFNFSDHPTMKVMPPQGTGLPAGVAPEAIKDPKMREQYQAAIDANAKKAREYDRQYMLRHLGESFSPKAERYLVRTYAKPPFKLEELRTYLNEYLTDGSSKERIINEVKKKIRQESAGVADPL